MPGVALSRCSSADADALGCRPVAGAVELSTHRAIRRVVFVDEQRLFDDDDLDAHDDDPATVHLLGWVGRAPAGTVRLYPLGGDRWQGDRLAVLPAYRRSGVGAPLVRTAVETAGQRGGTWMDAQVQAGNVAFFQRLGWATAGAPQAYLGRVHQSMTIALR